MHEASSICDAILSQHVIRFFYQGGTQAGYRTVEPHLVAYNGRDHLCMSGWFLGGTSESQSGQGWREYRLDCISDVTILPQQFPRTRPGFKADGGMAYHHVQCAVGKLRA